MSSFSLSLVLFDVLEEPVPQTFLLAGWWCSITVTAAGGEAKFYTNGQLQLTRNLALALTTDSAGQLTVGGRAGGEFFTRSIHNVSFYSEV